MSVLTPSLDRDGMRSLSASVDIESPPEDIFSLLCSIEKWPVWLSFLRSAQPVKRDEPVGLGSDVVLRSSLPGEAEELYEVDGFQPHYLFTLVGAYSARRRVDFRVEQKASRSRLHIRFSYPSYHGRFGALFDGWRRERKLLAALDNALANFKGLAEYRRDDGALADSLMPLYDYRCTSCGAVKEVRHGFDERFSEKCAACGGTLQRVFNPAPVLFKGSGFYVTDSRSKKSEKHEKSEATDKGDSAQKSEKTEKSETAEKGDSGKKSEKAESGSSGSGDKAGSKPSEATKSEKSEKGEKGEKKKPSSESAA